MDCTYQLRTGINKIFAYAAGNTILPQHFVSHIIFTAQPLMQPCSEYFIDRLLHIRMTAGFYQTSFFVYDLPLLFQPTIRGITGRHQINIFPCPPAKQNIAYIIRKIMFEKINVFPFQFTVHRLHPILVRQTQPVTPKQQLLRMPDAKLFQCLSDSRSACRNPSAKPPLIQISFIGNTCLYLYSNRAKIQLVILHYF